MLLRSPRGSSLLQLTMAAGAIGLFLIAYYWGNQYQHGNHPVPAIEGVLVLPAPPLVGFRLQDSTGQPFSTDNLAEHWTLLAFGDLSKASGHRAILRLIEIHNRLADDPDLQALLQLILVTQRHEGDLARDFGRLSPALKLLSGELDQVRRLRASVGTPSAEVAETPTDEAPLYLVGPSGRLLALFPQAQEAASIAADVSTISAHTDSLYPSDG